MTTSAKYRHHTWRGCSLVAWLQRTTRESPLTTKIYYDGECPFCTRYATLVRLREAVGPLALVDVREAPDSRRALENDGFDLDQGMVLEHAGERFGGAAAIHQVARLSDDGSLINHLLGALCGVPILGALVYALLRAGRGATLFALGRSRLRINAPETLSLFALFAQAWGVFSVVHLLYYIFYEGSTHVFPTTWAIGILGAWLAIRPREARVFVLLCITMLIDAWLQMPLYSNHTAVRNVVLVAIALSGGWAWLRGRGWSEFMSSFAPVGRVLLIVMYIFGVFHKLNTDWFDPTASCAVALWHAMPGPLPLLDTTWFHHLVIYGTLIVEAIIVVGLLLRRGRHLAIVAGIGFHSVLALSSYGFYTSFSALTIALHLLFLSPEGAQRIVTAPHWQRLQTLVHQTRGLLAAGFWVLLLWSTTHLQDAGIVGVIWLPWSLWLMSLVLRNGRVREGEKMIGPALISRTWAVNAVSLLFILNCFSPYLGLKNAQSINMFANLIYEGGQSNHLVFSGPPGPFHYLNDLVRPFDARGNQYLVYVEYEGLQVTWYDLLHQLDSTPNAIVSFERNGKTFIAQNAASLQLDIDRELHPAWFRNWFLFRPVDLSRPKPCSISQ